MAPPAPDDPRTVPPGALGARILAACHLLPAAELTHPFGPQPAVFKVGGKVFALFSTPATGGAPDRVTLKCDPDHAAALVREHPAVSRGYHMNKRHWITVDLDAGLPEDLTEDLVVDSYDLVVASLPRRLRVAVDVARRYPPSSS